jgi:transposase-like protein
MYHYQYGRSILEEQGWKLTGAVVDGRRGFLAVFKDIPVQICQFHQIKQVTKYLTRKPRTEAARELRTLVLTLTQSDEVTFTNALKEWHAQHGSFIEEKTISAYRSLMKNLPNLFTYLTYPELNMPNTTNDLDGAFSPLKKKLAAHHGLRRDRRYKVISELLKKSH